MKSELSAQKIELLNSIHFDWTLNRKIRLPWMVMYERLKAFRKIHGHTNVPAKWRKDPKLGKWVSRMRYKREKLAGERIVLLEALEFNWNRRPASIIISKVDSNQQLHMPLSV
jgi:hypothetical protein